TMLQEILLSSPMLKGKITGHFMVWIGISENGQQQLHWKIETKGPNTLTGSIDEEALCIELADLLGRLQPEFKEDYAKFYSHASGAKDRIFQFHFGAEGSVEKFPGYFTGVQKRKIIQNRSPV